MKILLAAAMYIEVKPLVEELEHVTGDRFLCNGHQLNLLIIGVGMVPAAFALAQALAAESYDLVLNLGIAGCYDKRIALGTLLEVREDVLAEFGVEESDQFIPFEQTGISKDRHLFVSDTRLNRPVLEALPKVKSVTVNTVSGKSSTIKAWQELYEPVLESMEGAAVFYACGKAGVPCVQVRAVSNYIGERDKDKWETGLAFKRLNEFGAAFISSL